MPNLRRFQKNGLPQCFLAIHEILLKDFVDHFEKGKDCRREIKKVRRAVKKAFKIAKKKKINPKIIPIKLHQNKTIGIMDIKYARFLRFFPIKIPILRFLDIKFDSFPISF